MKRTPLGQYLIRGLLNTKRNVKLEGNERFLYCRKVLYHEDTKNFSIIQEDKQGIVIKPTGGHIH